MTAYIFPSLFSLLHQVIDYAGLFPPADLPLETAMQNFIRYQAWPERWMLARFILPTAKLGELTQLCEGGLTWEGTLGFSVLGATNPAMFRAGVAQDVAMVKDFRARFGARVRCEVYETRFLNMERKETALGMLEEVIPILTEAGMMPFFEAPFGKGWEARAEALIQALAEVSSPLRAGFKLRTGGVMANAFPTPEQVAWALCACREAGVPLKCTAGLHHPVRSFRAEVGTKMHGFLNVFVAGVLARARGLDQAEVGQILAEEDPAGFAFSATEVAWRGWRATTAEVEAARREGIISFGSCSFEEPKEDLGALGLSLIKS
ncbi:MAG: hypothetical protein HUU38_16370 [Anaerolineales bacterium]|nr:hypothetical protein [Anaerolineales bacterium]